MNLNSNYFRYLCQFVRSLSHSVFYTLLVTSLVYTSLPIPRAFAAGRIDKGEVQSSLEVAQDYLDMVKHFEGILDGRPMDRHPLDTFSLLQQKAHLALDGSTRLVPWMNLDVSIRTFDEEKELFSTTMKANGNFKPGHGSETYYCRTSSPCRLTLSTEKLGTLNEFFFPAKAMTTFGPYVLFIKEHSFDSGKGTQTLSFVDLEGLSSLIGNEDIPVYDIELKMDQPLKEMKVVDGAIELNGDGLKLYPYQLADVSKIMYAAYNVKSNLVNPSTFNGALAQVDNFAHFMDQMAEITIEEEAREAHRAQRVVVDFARLKESLVADHRLQKTREEPRMAMDEKLASQNTHGRKVVGNAANVLASADAEEFLSESQKEMVKEFVTKLEENRQLDSALLGSQEKLLAGKKTFASFKRWVMYLMTPRPSRSNVIKNAIASIMTRIKMLGVKAHTEVYASGGLNLSAQVQLSVSQMSYRATKIVEWFSGRPLSTASMIGAGFLGVMFPEIYTATMEAGLAFGQGVVNYVNSALTGTYSAVIEGGGPVMEVLNPLRTIPVIDQAYVEGTKWTRTIIGVSGWLTVIAGILGLYHVSQNVVRLGLAMKKPGYEGFVPKMEKMVKQYNDSLAKAEAERLRMVSDKAKDFENRHPEEVKRLNEAAHKRIEEVKAMKDQAMKSSVVYKVFHPIMWTLKASGNAIVGLGKVTFGTVFRKLLGADSQRFFTALRVFIFSFASYTRTSLDYAAAWNFWSGLRYSTFSFARVRVGRHRVPYFIKFKPVGLAVRLFYPKFFNRVVATEVGHVTLPTEQNGGTRSLAEILAGLLNRQLNEAFLASSAKHQANRAKVLKEYESEVTKVEKRIASRVIKKATRELVRFLSSEGQLREIFESEGITDVTSRAFTYLNYANKSFLNAYFDSVFEASMKEVLAEIVAGSNQSAITSAAVRDFSEMTLNNPELATTFEKALQEADRMGSIRAATMAELKKIIISVNQQVAFGDFEQSEKIALSLSDQELDRIVNRVSEDRSHIEEATRRANAGVLSVSNWITNTKHNYTNYLDPAQNASLQRYAIVQRMTNDVQAMSRAVRQETVEMFTTLPIDLGFKMVMTAGITDGPLKPLQDSFMGENSVMYLSRMSYYNGMATGVALGMVANSWMKLQEDHFNAAEGNFGMVPEGNDADKSFFRWWLKQYMDREKNSLGLNYKRHWKIVAPNIPAALPNIAMLQLSPIGLGRLDLSLVLMGYAVSVLPISAWFYKMEQSFELAANYDAKYFPKELWDHPDVQSYLQKEAAVRRVKFNLLRDILLNPVGEALVNIEVTPTSTHGTRGWLRSVIPGNYLPEEAILNGTKGLAEATSNIPGVNHLTQGVYNFCEKILDGSYSEWTKVVK